jgi:two-component system NarL family sensor kinase
MVRGENTAGSQIMKRTEVHNYLILREAFFNRKAFLTFAYSPKPLAMNTYTFLSGREMAYAITLFLIILPHYSHAQDQRLQRSYETYLQKARQDTFSMEVRKHYLSRALTTIKPLPPDSVKYSKISKLVELSSHLEDSLLFQALARSGHQLARQIKHPALVADSHWNYGTYYLRLQRYDSSYYHYNHAYTHFIAAGREYYAGKMLYNMAYIASETNDLTGAEILLYRSIEIFERTHKPLQQYRCYNILGNNADDLGEFEKSLVYYRKAASLIPLLENARYYRLENYNNLGVRLYKMGLFEEAVATFEKALRETKVLQKKEALYAKLLDNRAFCLVALGRDSDVAPAMQQAMYLRDSIGDVAGSVTSRLRFAEYYGKIGDTIKGIGFAKDALSLAEKHSLMRNVLEALEILAGLDSPRTETYLREHINLNKALQARDRRLRNKFTAIQYQTDKYIQENERLFRQRLWISLGAIGLTFILLLIYWNSRQRARNRQLMFEREQQQYNEDLFLLRFREKSNLEKGRAEERERISQELHDNIVSRLFTLRFRWLSLSLTGEEQMISLHKQFLELLENLEFDIRNLSYDLKKVVFFWEEKYLEILENILKEKKTIGGFDTHFECINPGDWEQLSTLAKINLQRIFEEVLQNIVKHAQANMVNVIMNRELGNLELSIRDNGKGMNLSKLRKGLGLKSLENRTEKLQGKIEVISSPGSGTTIQLQIPFKLNIE